MKQRYFVESLANDDGQESHDSSSSVSSTSSSTQTQSSDNNCVLIFTEILNQQKERDFRLKELLSLITSSSLPPHF